MTPRCLAIALALATTAVSFGATADGTGGSMGAAIAEPTSTWQAAPAPSQNELLRRAQSAEKELRLAEAAALYRRALEAEPSSRLARRARARLSWLEARSEDDYGPLSELMGARKNAAAPEPATVEAFEARVATFPQGLVRREALQLLAETYLHRLHDPSRALTAYRAWADSPDLPEGERQLATSGAALATAALGRGDPGGDMSRAGLGYRAEAVFLRAERIGRIGSWIAYLTFAAFVAAALAKGGWRGWRGAGLRRALGPARLAVAGYTLGVPLAILWLYDHRLAPQLGWVVAACALVLLSASVLGSGLDESPSSPRWRPRLAGLAALATLGAAFVASFHSRLLFDLMLSLEGR